MPFGWPHVPPDGVPPEAVGEDPSEEAGVLDGAGAGGVSVDDGIIAASTSKGV